MITLAELVNWYEEQCQIAIREGNLPVDVTSEEAFEYIEFIYGSQTSGEDRL